MFAGSSAGARPEYRAAAAALGHALSERGIELVYGGAHVGLMGVAADADDGRRRARHRRHPRGAGGEGARPHRPDRAARRGSMHERKALMAELSDGFIALPGGWGTWEELFEVLTWAQLGLHRKPCGLLNVGGYFDGLLAFMTHAVQEGFVRPQQNAMLLVADHARRAARPHGRRTSRRWWRSGSRSRKPEASLPGGARRAANPRPRARRSGAPG